MINEITELDIFNLKKIFDDIDLPNTLIEKSAKLPISSIIVNYMSENNTNIDISFVFVPLPENQFSGIKILQIYFEFPLEIEPSNEQLVFKLTNQLNYLLTVGHFASNGKNLSFRYCYTLPLFSNISEHEKAIEDLITLIIINIETFELPLREVFNGQLSLDELLSTIQS